MSPLQIRGYLIRQMHEMRASCRSVVNTWADYLSMAKRLKMDVNDAIIYRTRQLRKRHDKLVKICQERVPELRLAEMSEKYPGVDAVCKGLEKYEYQGESYSVLAPAGVGEILAEGDALHHCVAQERYFERIERGESYILFLRKNTALGELVERGETTVEISFLIGAGSTWDCGRSRLPDIQNGDGGRYSARCCPRNR